jgi:hypothetical protein
MPEMTYTITWTGVSGPQRRTGLSAAEAVSWHKSYSPLAADFLIFDEAGSLVAVDDLKVSTEERGS